MRLIDADEFERRIKKYDTTDYADKALYNFAHNEMITMPTVCDIEQIRAEIIKQFEGCYLEEDMTDERKAEHKAYKNVLQIIDKYRK